MKTLDQERATFAWQKVQKCKKEYSNLAKGAPALIMGNGLMQTLAFFQAKEEDARKLGDHIREWVCRRFEDPFRETGFQPFMQALTAADSDLYLQVTEESLEFLRWVRQFAAALAS